MLNTRTKKIIAGLLIAAPTIMMITTAVILQYLSCRDCSSTNHGGSYDWYCGEFYVPLFVSLITLLVGVVGSGLIALIIIKRHQRNSQN
jgi:uncharacterized membrane protein